MSYRLIDANALIGEISYEDYEKVQNAPCIYADLPNEMDGGMYLAIPAHEGMTNGDMIKAMFPNAQIDYHEKSDLVDRYVTVFIRDCDTCQDYSYDWWNAPYKKEEK